MLRFPNRACWTVLATYTLDWSFSFVRHALLGVGWNLLNYGHSGSRTLSVSVQPQSTPSTKTTSLSLQYLQSQSFPRNSFGGFGIAGSVGAAPPCTVSLCNCVLASSYPRSTSLLTIISHRGQGTTRICPWWADTLARRGHTQAGSPRYRSPGGGCCSLRGGVHS